MYKFPRIHVSVSQVSVQVVDQNEDPEFVRDIYTARIFSIAFYKSPVVYVQVKPLDDSSFSELWCVNPWLYARAVQVVREV